MAVEQDNQTAQERLSEAAMMLAEAATAMLHMGEAHPATQARRAYRAERQGPLEERYMYALMLYQRRRERAQGGKPRQERV